MSRITGTTGWRCSSSAISGRRAARHWAPIPAIWSVRADLSRPMWTGRVLDTIVDNVYWGGFTNDQVVSARGMARRRTPGSRSRAYGERQSGHREQHPDRLDAAPGVVARREWFPSVADAGQRALAGHQRQCRGQHAAGARARVSAFRSLATCGSRRCATASRSSSIWSS